MAQRNEDDEDDPNRRFPQPPARETEDGTPRRIGVELELIGPDVVQVAELVAQHIGGEAERRSRYEYVIRGDGAGDWRVELDQELLKRMGREREEQDGEVSTVTEAAEELLRLGSELLVPVEVISPPLPMERLPEFEPLTDALREAGGKGTAAGLAYAFGLQFNPELPALDAATITRYLKAFLCLYDWLRSRSDVDATRIVTGFARPFPGRYVRKVIDPDYWPDRDTLIDDYLADNPTRNRALDLLPLFDHIDPEKVGAAVDDPRVKPRPTLHYRLPNSELSRKEWGVHVAWSDWLQVEHLASDEDRLDGICRAYREMLEKPLAGLVKNWAEESGRWLVDPEDL